MSVSISGDGSVTGIDQGLNVVGVVTATTISVGSGTSVSSPATNVLTLGTNNVERVRVDSSGNTGIGTINPIGVLAVSGGVSNPTITFQNGSATNTASDAAVGSIVGYSRTTGGNINIGSVDIRTDTNSASSGAVRILTASNGSLAEKFRITSSGKTGINNTNPLSTLSVGTRTSDVSDSSLIFTAGGSSSGGEVLAATFCNTAVGASNNATAISFTCRSGDSQTAKIVAMQPSGASSPNTQLDFYVYGSSGSTKIVTFDQNGRVTAPYQPAFKIGVNSRTATGSNRILSTDAGDSFLTDRDYFNTGNHFNGSNGRFTAPVTGTYMFIFSFMRANASGSEIDVRIQKNSTGISANMYARAYASAYTSNYQQSIIVTTTKLNVNDWVNVSITGSTSVYNDDTYFAGHLMY